jgi:hypothetical protein
MMNSSSRLRPRVASFLALALIASAAHAEGPRGGSEVPPSEGASAPAAAESTQAQAESLKAEGDTHFRARNYLDAVVAYDKAYALVTDARVLYNKGRALEALGRHGLALETLTLFEKTASAELKSQVQGLPDLMAALRQRVCELTVQVNVEGAEVRLGNEVLGTAPLSGPALVNAGTTELTVEKEGYFETSRKLTLAGGGVANIEVTLQSKATNAKLTIKSGVKGASVRVDGKPLGQAPSEIVLLPGAHTVLAQHEDHHDASLQVVLIAGQDRTVVLDPEEKKKAFYQQWWFWTGLGVVAAGAATTVIILNNQPEQTEGDFSPNTIRAPLVRY